MNATTSHNTRKFNHAATLGALLCSVAILGVFLPIALVSYQRTHRRAISTRIDQDIETLNRAVVAYITNGGIIGSGLDSQQVLSKLKTRVTNPEQFAGACGPFVDLRLVGEPVEPGHHGMRIAWSPSQSRFTLSGSGNGWERLTLQNTGQPVTLEDRRSTFEFASVSDWVWDYEDVERSMSPLPSEPETGDSGEIENSNTAYLDPPMIDHATGFYDATSYPLSVALVDPNPSGLGRIKYSLNGGPWEKWMGTPVLIEESPSSHLAAFVASASPHAKSSIVVTQIYQTCSFLADVQCVFDSIQGEPWLTHETSSASSTVTWGNSLDSGVPGSCMKASSSSGLQIKPGVSMPMGTIYYRNSDTRAGTNITRMNLKIRITITSDITETVVATVPVSIANTIHYPWLVASERNDHLRFGDAENQQIPVTVFGKRFTLRVVLANKAFQRENDLLSISVEEGDDFEAPLLVMLDQS